MALEARERARSEHDVSRSTSTLLPQLQPQDVLVSAVLSQGVALALTELLKPSAAVIVPASHRSELCPPYAPFLGFAGVAAAVSPLYLFIWLLSSPAWRPRSSRTVSRPRGFVRAACPGRQPSADLDLARSSISTDGI